MTRHYVMIATVPGWRCVTRAHDLLTWQATGVKQQVSGAYLSPELSSWTLANSYLTNLPVCSIAGLVVLLGVNAGEMRLDPTA